MLVKHRLHDGSTLATWRLHRRLALPGFEYDYAKRCIHPLLVDTGLKPFDGDRTHFFTQARPLRP